MTKRISTGESVGPPFGGHADSSEASAVSAREPFRFPSYLHPEESLMAPVLEKSIEDARESDEATGRAVAALVRKARVLREKARLAELDELMREPESLMAPVLLKSIEDARESDEATGRAVAELVMKAREERAREARAREEVARQAPVDYDLIELPELD
jgi:hypothetical protein